MLVVHQIWTQRWHWKEEFGNTVSASVFLVCEAWSEKQERLWKNSRVSFSHFQIFPRPFFQRTPFFASCPTDWVKDRSMRTRLYCLTCQIKDIIQIWVTTACYCVARARCVTPHFHCSLFFRQQMFYFSSWKIANKVSTSFLIFSWILEAVHVPLLTCATEKSPLSDKHADRPAVMHCHWVIQQDWTGLSPLKWSTRETSLQQPNTQFW